MITSFSNKSHINLMKKSFIIKAMTIILIVLSVFGTITCKKNNDGTNEQELLMQNHSKINNDIDDDLINYPSVRLYIISEDSNPSGMRFLGDGTLQRYGNASIGTYSTIKGTADTKTNMKSVAACFPKFLKSIHGSDDYLITYYEHYYLDDAEVIKMEYVINNNLNNPESVIVHTDLTNTAKVAPPTTIVKCMGHCDKPTESCVEVHSNGEVRCSCQSDDCYMVVKEVENDTFR